MPVTAADLAIPEEETSTTPLPVDEVAAADEEDTTAQDVAAADDLTADEAPAGGDTAIPEGGAPSGGAKITRVADIQEPAPPPLIPYHPAMSTDQKKLIDHLNARNMQMFKGEQAKYNHALTSADQDRRLEYRLNRSEQRAKELQRGQQGYTTLEHQRQEAVRARQAEQQRNASVEENKRKEQAAFEKTPEGRFQKEMEGGRKQTAMADDTLGGGGDSDRAAERMLDAGLAHEQDARAKRREQMPQRGADYDTPADAEGLTNKRDRMSTLEAAYTRNQQFLEQSIKNNSALNEGQRTTMLNVPGVKLNDAQKREFFPIVDRVLRNNDTDPAAAMGALHDLVYGLGRGVTGKHSVNIKTGELVIGDPKEAAPTRLFISGQDYRTLMEMRARYFGELNGYLDGLAKKNGAPRK